MKKDAEPRGWALFLRELLSCRFTKLVALVLIIQLIRVAYQPNTALYQLQPCLY
jgi:hypothetical protein